MRSMFGKKSALVVGAAALLALPACSSLPATRDAPSSYKASLDSEVMAAVESGAQRSGAEVYWINPPKRSRKD